MPANSLPRRLLKRALAPVLNERSYRVIQSVAMAWDIRSGSWSEPELELIPLALRPGECALDIGANYGLWAYHMSRAMGGSGRVHCFEPVPFTSDALRLVSRLLRFKGVELHAKGCGERAGRVTFTVPVQDNGAMMAGLVHMGDRHNEREGRARHARFERTRTVECDVVAIDDYLPHLADVALLKCDIEGADLYALRGAARTIERCHPTVICEINPWFLEGYGLRVADLVDFFAALGYEVHRYEHRRLIPTRTEDIVEDNWVFVHPDRRPRLAALLP